MLLQEGKKDGWLRVEEGNYKRTGNVKVKQYRACTNNRKLRHLTTSQCVAIAGMHADRLEDDRQRRNGGIVTDPGNPASWRNFTPELWQLVGRHQRGARGELGHSTQGRSAAKFTADLPG
jgi:hypothetical protein